MISIEQLNKSNEQIIKQIEKLGFILESKTEPCPEIEERIESLRELMKENLDKILYQTEYKTIVEKNQEILLQANNHNNNIIDKLHAYQEELESQIIPMHIVARFEKEQYKIEAEKQNNIETIINGIPFTVTAIINLIIQNNNMSNEIKPIRIETISIDGYDLRKVVV